MAVRIAAFTVWFILLGMARAELFISADADNDVVRALPPESVKRFDSPAEAIAAADPGAGVLILADRYPQERADVKDDLLARATEKKLRLYIEYPQRIAGLTFDTPRQAQWERGVIASDFFSEALPKMRIVQPHACHFLPVKTSGPVHLVISRVAGYDTAVYGVGNDALPLLLETDDGWLVATTKLSNFNTGRYAPTAEWKLIWKGILKWLDPAFEHELKIDPTVRPAYAKDEKLPEDVERATFERAAKFYHRSRLLISEKRNAKVKDLLQRGVEVCDVRKADDGGDGSLGMMEGYASQILPDGNQMQRTLVRSDCNAEAAMVLALAGDEKSKRVASNLLDFVFSPDMQTMGRLDPKHPAFGLIAWGAYSPAWMIANYGDDDARVILSGVAASAAMQSDRWDQHLLRALLANVRTTGQLGFRGDRIDIPQLEQHGWKHFHDAETVNLSPHFESALWTCYLWAYERTGESEFLDRTRAAIRMTMDAYAKKQWRWMDNMERARMLWCLAWLVRIEDTPEHRGWLTTIARDLLDAQQPCGAIQERLGGSGGGHYQVPQSNEAYGTTETPLIQRVGDPCTDQLYATGFALIALHEAAGATGDAKLRAAEDKLADFLCRIQVRSSRLDYLDGAWFRAFDYQRWDYWASSADMGWGAWSVEAGWGPAWIAAALALRDRQTTLWELTAGSNIKRHIANVRADMAQSAGGPISSP